MSLIWAYGLTRHVAKQYNHDATSRAWYTVLSQVRWRWDYRSLVLRHRYVIKNKIYHVIEMHRRHLANETNSGYENACIYCDIYQQCLCSYLR